jgi:hypothetical protein
MIGYKELLCLAQGHDMSLRHSTGVAGPMKS